ncbi:hypothetical protein F383_29087 [Gossypium arboreum]|uniref:Uncharacterized protein n=1 Tax=Gossypium arboreum TaxID=29729 RepID=A0A0B0PE07_GOSAR|nr:hypothetical protein F383_29087 [Gossypium arboreum]
MHCRKDLAQTVIC